MGNSKKGERAEHPTGDLPLSLFNVHHGGHCLMPFHVYEGLTGRLITTVIRPGKTYVRVHLPAAAPVSGVFAGISELVTAPDTS